MRAVNRHIKNLRRLSGAATKKLPHTTMNLVARPIRDVILDEHLNRHAERYDVGATDDACLEATGALGAARDIAVALDKNFKAAHLTGYRTTDWFQACGLDPSGALYENLFDDDAEERAS